MQTIIKLSKKINFISCITGPRLWRVTLWQNKSGIPWLPGNDGFQIDINAVFVNGRVLDKSADIAALRNYASPQGSFFQDGQNLYIRFPLAEGESPVSMSAQNWMYSQKLLGVTLGITDGNFFFGRNNSAFMPGIMSGYTQKISVENDSYKTLKFNSQTLKILKRELDGNPFDYIGQPCNVETVTGELIDTMLVKSATHDLDTVTLKLKDPREQYTDKVIDQQFNIEDYKNQNVVVMDKETAKNYKGDAIGYCIGVPGICIDARKGWEQNVPEKQYRRYRVSYGKIDVDDQTDENGVKKGRVEIEGENGWISLPAGNSNGTGARYWKETITETLPDYRIIETELICVPVRTAHGVQSGTDTPDFEADAKPLRVSGTFHNELPNITNCLEIWKYLVDRYSTLPYSSTYYNIKELETAIAEFNNHPIGVYFEEPVDFYNAVGQLQSGCHYGWQLCVYKGKITAKVDKPDTASVVSIPAWDIVNFSELVIDADAENYVSNLIVKYSKNYSEDTLSEYKNRDIEEKVLSIMTVSKSKTVETLLKDKEDAVTRYNTEIARSIGITPRIEGIKLRLFEEYRCLRQFDTVTMDFGGLTAIKTWRVNGVQIDYQNESVTIDVTAKPEAFV